MGTKDSKAKEYLSDNTRFSEICNYVLFDGEKVIKPEDLKECDTTEVLSVFGIDKKQIVKQKWRDLLKSVSVKHTGQMYVILITENRSTRQRNVTGKIGITGLRTSFCQALHLMIS